MTLFIKGPEQIMDVETMNPDSTVIEEEETATADYLLYLKEHKDQPGNLIPLLQAAQSVYGYIPEKIILYINSYTKIPVADIYGVITFYAQFRLKPMGKNIVRVCEGTACHVNGAKTVLSTLQDELGIDVGDTTEDGYFSLVSVACIGCCSLAPVMMINSETHGNLTSDKIRKVFKKFKTVEAAS